MLGKKGPEIEKMGEFAHESPQKCPISGFSGAELVEIGLGREKKAILVAEGAEKGPNSEILGRILAESALEDGKRQSLPCDEKMPPDGRLGILEKKKSPKLGLSSPKNEKNGLERGMFAPLESKNPSKMGEMAISGPEMQEIGQKSESPGVWPLGGGENAPESEVLGILSLRNGENNSKEEIRGFCSSGVGKMPQKAKIWVFCPLGKGKTCQKAKFWAFCPPGMGKMCQKARVWVFCPLGKGKILQKVENWAFLPLWRGRMTQTYEKVPCLVLRLNA